VTQATLGIYRVPEIENIFITVSTNEYEVFKLSGHFPSELRVDPQENVLSLKLTC
jgi:hypothetical protein